MKDIAGCELMVGDTVAFNRPRYKGLSLGKVIKFTTKMVTVEYTPYSGSKDTCNVYPSDLVVVGRDLI